MSSEHTAAARVLNELRAGASALAVVREGGGLLREAVLEDQQRLVNREQLLR